MPSWKILMTGFVGLAMGSSVWAQVPSAGGLGGTSPLGAGVAAAPAAAAAPRTIWGFFGLSADNLKACRDKFCSCQLGQMINNLAAGPVSSITGGFICAPCPPVPSPAAIQALENKPNGAAEAAAAKIKASEADAKARVAAVEYLGTVDCDRFPDARKALVSALREDPNECVRYAAAKALQSGCCCDQEVIERLRICVAGETKDQAPAESSPRVKAAAFAALQNCLMRVPEELEAPAEQPARPEGEELPEPLPGEIRARPEQANRGTGDAAALASLRASSHPGGSAEAASKPFTQTVEEARRTLFETSRTPLYPSQLPPGKRSLYSALLKARQDVEAKARQNPPPAAAPRDPQIHRGSYEMTPSDSPGSTTRPVDRSFRPSAAGKRGLLGLLFKPREIEVDVR
jgi:hypothetical protein